MYYVIKSVIGAGNYKLADIRQKVKKMYLLGDLSEAQMEELLDLSSKKAAPEGERPEVLTMLQRLSERLDALSEEVAVLRGTSVEKTEYEIWTSWDGISDRYQPGSIVRHNGTLWRSVYPGQNVWEPDTALTQFWEMYQGE